MDVFAPTNNSSYIGRVISFYFVFVFVFECKGQSITVVSNIAVRNTNHRFAWKMVSKTGVCVLYICTSMSNFI